VKDTRGPRPLLRRRRRWAIGLGLSVVIGAGALGVLGQGLTVYKVINAMPTWAVDRLERLGVDDAMTVIADRAIADEFSQAQWDLFIERALDHQADRAAPWEPRWGDVLARAVLDRRLSSEQLLAYFTNGMTTQVVIRDRISADAQTIPYKVRWFQDRMWARLPPGSAQVLWDTTPLWVTRQVRREGVIGIYEPPERDGSSSGMQHNIYTGPGQAGSFGTEIMIFRTTADAPPDAFTAFIELTVTIRDEPNGSVLAETELMRHEQRVRRLAPGVPLITARADPEAALDIARSTEVSDFSVAPLAELSTRSMVANLSFRTSGGSGSFAGSLYLVTEGAELRVGELSIAAGGSSERRMIVWVHRDDERRAWKGALERALDLGHADFVFRTEVGAGEGNAAIDSIVDVTLWFRDVPISSKEPRGTITWHQPEPFPGADPGVPPEASD